MYAKFLLVVLAVELAQKIRHLGISELVPRGILLPEKADIERFAAGPAGIVVRDGTKEDVNLAEFRQAGQAIEDESLRGDSHSRLFESLARRRPFEGLAPLHEPGRWSPCAQRVLLGPPA